MSIGIVILNYNDSQSVLHLYNKIKNYKNIDNIVIVDNCSKDNSYEILKKTCFCDVIRTEKNGGYAYGNNVGIKWLIERYNSSIIFVSNPDVQFTNDFIFNIVKEMKLNKKIGVMSGVMLNTEGKVVKNAYGVLPTYYRDLFECFYLVRYFTNHILRRKINYNMRIMKVDVIWGSLFAISSETFKEIGGFDENTFLYHEENIIGKKIKEVGKYEALLTDVNFKHLHAVTITKSTSRMYRHCVGMNSKLYYQRHYNKISYLKCMVLKFVIKYSILEVKIINCIINLIR